MSMANRATTHEEARRFERHGFYHSALESMGSYSEGLYRGYWAHPTLTPGGHVGPDEVLRIIDALPEPADVPPAHRRVRRTRDKLVSVFYALMRDGYITPRELESRVTQGCGNPDYEYPMAREDLADKAEELAVFLRSR